MIHISEILTNAPTEERDKIEKTVFSLLEKFNIPFERVDNDVVEAMDECEEINKVLGTEIRKTILLRNKKKTSFLLVVMPAQKSLNTKLLSKKIDISNLSFASAELMETYLGVKPGSASVMSLINDENNQVQLIIDKEVAEDEWFGCNTGINTCHIKIKTQDLLKKFLPEIKHEAKIVELEN